MEKDIIEYAELEMEKERNALDWEIMMYKKNVTKIEERIAYKNVLLNDDLCEEEKDLPRDLVITYINNGTNLACPDGTESDRGSYCIGQC